jgi:hypothetical protein
MTTFAGYPGQLPLAHAPRLTVNDLTAADGVRLAVGALPAGAPNAQLNQVAVSGSRVVATGGPATAGAATRAFAELSANGGMTWRQTLLRLPEPDTAVTRHRYRPGRSGTKPASGRLHPTDTLTQAAVPVSTAWPSMLRAV